jgi:hypothetical protein
MLLSLLSTLLPLITPFSIVGSNSAPATDGIVHTSSVPANTSHIEFLHLSGNSSAPLVLRYSAAVAAASREPALAWNVSLPAGVYMLRAMPSLQVCASQVMLFTGYSLLSIVDPLARYSTAGRQMLTVRGRDVFPSAAVVVRFAGSSGQIDAPGTVDADASTITTTTPAWSTPTDWCVACPSDLQRPPDRTRTAPRQDFRLRRSGFARSLGHVRARHELQHELLA